MFWFTKHVILGAVGLGTCGDSRSVILGGGMEDLSPFALQCPMYLFHVAVLELYPFIINW